MDPREHVPALVARAIGGEPRALTVTARPLRGGIDGSAVTELSAAFVDPGGRRGILRVVAKHLRGDAIREAAVYQRVVARHVAPLGPRLLAAVEHDGGVVLYLEALRHRSAWPWRERRPVEGVLEAVATLHAAPAGGDLPPWDYDGELTRRAGEALEAADRARGVPAACFLRGSMAPLRRLAGDVRSWRRALLGGPLAPCAIHGDLHTGNVVVGAGATPRITLLDWGRARVGSPFEDVCSWLQSLAFWEPTVRRRHDTLLKTYLTARGVAPPASPAVREAYWLAGASNALSGALAYHLHVGTGHGVPPRQRERSLTAARDWLRIVRRADAVWQRRGRDQAGRARSTAPAACAVASSAT
jgi:hypothetical protein